MTTLADSLLALATSLARDAGTMVREGRTTGPGAIETKSTATDVVTEYDKASEALITSRLRVARPDDGLLGEEGTSEIGTSGITWVIDPIDGTTNYLYGLPGYSVSVAAVDADGGLVGVVYAPMTDELFSARRGGGAFVNGTPISCRGTRPLESALVSTGFGYLAERRARHGARVARLLPHVRDIRRMGSAALDLCYVAAGRVDVYFEQWLNPWDVAAGELIAREAGARVGEFPGEDDDPAGVLAASPALFDDFLALLATL